jgi:hypothetical protein
VVWILKSCIPEKEKEPEEGEKKKEGKGRLGRCWGDEERGTAWTTFRFGAILRCRQAGVGKRSKGGEGNLEEIGG